MNYDDEIARALNRDERVLVGEVLDLRILLDRVDCDWDLLAEMIEIYEESLSGHRAALRRAVEGGESKDLQQSAHALKGAVGAFSAEKAQAAAYRLETIGRDNRLSEAPAALAELDAEIARLKPALLVLRRAGNPSDR